MARMAKVEAAIEIPPSRTGYLAELIELNQLRLSNKFLQQQVSFTCSLPLRVRGLPLGVNYVHRCDPAQCTEQLSVIVCFLKPIESCERLPRSSRRAKLPLRQSVWLDYVGL